VRAHPAHQRDRRLRIADPDVDMERERRLSRHLPRALLDSMAPRRAAEVLRAVDTESMLGQLERRANASKRANVLLPSLTAAYREVQTLQGPDSEKWAWGRLHHSLPAHPLLDVVNSDLKAKLQVGPIPTPGSAHTPNAASYRSSDFRQTGGASFRIVMDVGNWDNSRAMNYPGQSGDPDSPHYRDLTNMWVKGEYFPLLYSRAAVEMAADQRIQLLPRK
jgi:penicillin amidase